jgi:hypothetical protein
MSQTTIHQTIAMPNTSQTTAFGPSAASRAAHAVAAAHRNQRRPLRIGKAEHWKAGPVTVNDKSSNRDERTDSKFEPNLTILPGVAISQTQDVALLSPLPVTARSDVHTFARTKPVDFTQYFRSLDFEFDARTADGISAFTAWRNTLGHHAWSVRSLTVKHWTTYWGFGENAWTSSEDKTHFARDPTGDLVITRALPTPAQETCKCTVAQLLAQLDPGFEVQEFRGITNMTQFVDCFRADCIAEDGQASRPTPVDAATTFVELLQGDSRQLSRDYGLAGIQCFKCVMPKLYLCGHLSTSAQKDGSPIVFDARAFSKTDSA